MTPTGILVAVSVLFIATYAVVALLRLRYRYEVEWIEGGMVNHVAQIRAGHGLYVRPSFAFIPDIYTPLYFYVAAAVSYVTGVGFFALRLVSVLSSVALFAAIGALTYRETRDRATTIIAVGLFAACYRISGAWLDIAREDTLCLALLFCGMYVVRDAHTARRGALAGVLFSLAFLSKQVALLPAIAVGPYLLVTRRGRRTTIAYGATLAVLLVGTTVLFDALSHGWYRFYVFTLPSHHAIANGEWWKFFARDLASWVPLVVALGVVGVLSLRRGERASGMWFHLLIGGAIGAAAYSARLHTGGYDNVLLPLYAETAIVAAIGLRVVLRWVDGNRRLTALVVVLCLAQFARLAYNPVAQVPRSGDSALGDRVIAALRELPQPVYVPGHPWYLHQAGLPGGAQSAAIEDIFRAHVAGTDIALASTLWQDVADRRYGSVVVDSGTGYSYLPDNFCQYYVPARPLLDDRAVSYPLTGVFTGPAEVWVPRAAPDDRGCWGAGSWTVSPFG